MASNKQYVDLVTPDMRRMWDSIRSNTDIKDMPGEIWIEADGSNGVYEVSTFMRIRTTKRLVINNNGEICSEITPKVLKQGVSPGCGYWEVRFNISGKRINKRVHRVYALSFHKNCVKENVVNHKNLIKTDNIPCNLELITAAENTKHAWLNGAIHTGERVKHSKLSALQVLEIYNSKDTSKVIELKYGINRRMVYKIKSGKSWKSVTGGVQVFNKRTYCDDIVKSVYLDKNKPIEIVKKYNIPMSVVCRIKNNQSYKNITSGLNK